MPSSPDRFLTLLVELQLTDLYLAIIAVTMVFFLLVVGMFFYVTIEQRKLRAVHEKNIAVLTQNEQRYRRLVKYTPFPMIVFLGEIVAYINDAGARLLNINNPEDLVDQSISKYVAPEYFAILTERFRSLSEDSVDILVNEEKMVLPDDKMIDIEMTAISILFDDKPAIQAVIKDITERKQFEAQIIYAKVKAEQSEKLKDSFIANISHEIRTPLNIILGYTGLIASLFEDRIRKDETEFFESIQRGGQRLMRTVEHILNISSIQTGNFQVHPEQIDISARVAKIAQDMQPLAQEKGLTLDFVNDCRKGLILADRYCIDQAITNLTENAIKFTNKGGVTLHVYRENQWLAIEIKDSGIGISPEYLPKVFSVFSQEIAGYSRPFEGLGLGLALTKRYIELNNGSVTVKSRKGSGSSFVIRFLSSQDDPVAILPSENQTTSAVRHVQKSASRLPRSLLVVEDDLETQKYMTSIFREEFELHIASSSVEAWDVLRHVSVDLVLMDLSLKGKDDGLQILRDIRSDSAFASLPVFIVTAHAFPEDKERSLAAGCDRYFSKPFSIEELRNAIVEFLQEAESSA
jgi:PAS domain S-box-containing protein